MNLVIALLVSQGYVSKDRIRRVVEGYRDQTDEAFEKMFERDKEELREIGIPIELGSNDKMFGDEPGYRIRRDAFELPRIDLEPDEAAAVGLAARVWQHARLARQTSTAVLKLKAAGVAVDSEALTLVEPLLAASEAAFEPLWDAVVAHRQVTFGYRRPGHEPTTRRVQPWGVLSWRGRWYLIGHDLDRTAERMFRLSRVTGPVDAPGPSDAFEVPAGTDLRALARQLEPRPAEGTATVRLLAGQGQALRRRATSVTAARDGWDAVELPLLDPVLLAAEVVSLGPAAVVVAPPEVREAVVHRLQRLAGEAVPR
ncbi:WYL domain-containing protein [soil metagenome]